jgi:serine/threonine protein kinase
VLTLARALDYVHSQGILHCDIKPANVLLTLRDGPQLIDFGLARASESSEREAMTLCGGTPPYMAPEQLEALIAPDRWKHVGVPADLYGLGLLMNELLTGRSPDLPDLGLPLPHVVRRLLNSRAIPPSVEGPSRLRVPKALRAIATRCLAYLPSDRYQDAGSMVEDLRRYLDRRRAMVPRHLPRLLRPPRTGRQRSASTVAVRPCRHEAAG